jgi:hypothetical protein
VPAGVRGRSAECRCGPCGAAPWTIVSAWRAISRSSPAGCALAEKPFSCTVTYRDDGQLQKIVEGVGGELSTLGVQALAEVALLVQQTYCNEW